MPRARTPRPTVVLPDYEVLCNVARSHRDTWSIQYRPDEEEPFVATPHDTRLTAVTSRSLAVLDLMLTACPVPVTPIVHHAATPAEYATGQATLGRVLAGLRALPVDASASVAA